MDKKNRKTRENRPADAGGILNGLANLLEKLGDLAEIGDELRRSGEFEAEPGGKAVRGVYGFSIKTGLGDRGGVKVEPFGNVHKDHESGKTVVDEIHEPLVDVFDEHDHVLVVAELPGIADEDVQLELKDDILTITAARGIKKYRKEVLLPATFSTDKMTRSCRNGVLELTFTH